MIAESLLIAMLLNGANLNGNVAYQHNSFGANQGYGAITISDVIKGKALVELGGEDAVKDGNPAGLTGQVIGFLPKGFSVGGLLRAGLNNFEPDGFVQIGPNVGYGFKLGKGRVNASVGASATFPLEDGSFGSPQFGGSGYLSYTRNIGNLPLTAYALGIGNGFKENDFRMLRAGVKVGIPFKELFKQSKREKLKLQ